MRKGYMASTRSPFVPSGKGKGEAPANAFATGGAETEDRSVDVPLGKNREALIKGENGGLKVPDEPRAVPGSETKGSYPLTVRRVQGELEANSKLYSPVGVPRFEPWPSQLHHQI